MKNGAGERNRKEFETIEMKKEGKSWMKDVLSNTVMLHIRSAMTVQKDRISVHDTKKKWSYLCSGSVLTHDNFPTTTLSTSLAYHFLSWIDTATISSALDNGGDCFLFSDSWMFFSFWNYIKVN